MPGIVRSLVGVSLPRLVAYGALCSALVIVLRLLWVFPGARFSYFIRRRILHQTETLSLRERRYWCSGGAACAAS